MPTRFPASTRAPKKPEDIKRAVLLSVLCSLSLILMLTLVAKLLLPGSPPLAGSGGSGAGSGSGDGLSGSGGSGGTGPGPDGDANGTSTGTGAGGDARGDATTSGTDTGTMDGKGAFVGTAPIATGQSDGQPAAGTTAPVTDTHATQTGSAKTAATPPPVPPLTPSKAPPVMALGNLAFTDTTTSVGTGPAAGGPAGPAFFGSRGRGTKFVYIVDRSGSMSGERFEAAREELKKSIKSLRTGMSFHVIFYDSNHEEMPGNQLQPVTTDSISKAIKWIDSQSPRGGTEPEEAMLKALELKPHTIWLLTDGNFSESICDRIAPANPGRQVSINTVAFHDQSGEPLLKRIAAENRGDYRFVPAPNSGPLQSTPLDRKTEWERLFGKGAKP